MINLLPPDIKKQQQFARYNSALVRYMVLVFIVAGAMSLIVLGGKYYADSQLSQLEDEHQEQQAQISDLQSVQQEADDINNQLSLTEALIEQQSYYSNFINELALAVPSWAKIQQLNLSRQDDDSDTELRVDINFELESIDRVAELQREILTMERVDFVDVQNGTEDSEGRATATLALGLNTPPYEKLSNEESEE